MSELYDCTQIEVRPEALTAAGNAISAGQLVVLPTDTVYGLAADAFTPDAVTALLAAKGRSRRMPVPVLVDSRRMLEGVVDALSEEARALADAFWPGALTLVVRHGAALNWDLGETRGTVAVRMPDHPLTRELLAITGPLAVSSANRSGSAPATSAQQAEDALGESVAVYLDAGPTAGSVPSSIVDVTAGIPRLLRTGAIGLDRLRDVAPVDFPD